MENAEVLTKKKTHRRKAGGKRKKDKNENRVNINIFFART